MIDMNQFENSGGFIPAPPPPKPTPVKVPMPKPGTYVIIRVNGDVEIHEEVPTMRAIGKAIGCTVADTVNLKSHPGFVMMVDDTGSGIKPPNHIGTALYHLNCKPGTKHKICGDVAICWDEDFAP